MTGPDGDGASFLLTRLRRRGLFLGALAVAGAAGGLALYALRPASFRAVETLAVVDPRPGGTSAIDYNLTPVRSYVALVSSPALAAPCATHLGLPATVAAPAVRVRMPENTRLLEISLETADPRSGAAFVRCVAAAAIAENRRLNEEQTAGAKKVWSAAVTTLREELARRDAALARAKGTALPRTTRSLLDAALDKIERGRGGADEAAPLERKLARIDEEIGPLERARDAAASALGEAERREALASVENASRAFDLVCLAPAVPAARPSGASRLTMAALGVAAALLLGAFSVLSSPVRGA